MKLTSIIPTRQPIEKTLILAKTTIIGVIRIADSGVFTASPKTAYSLHKIAQPITSHIIPKGSIRFR